MHRVKRNWFHALIITVCLVLVAHAILFPSPEQVAFANCVETKATAIHDNVDLAIACAHHFD